MQATDVANQQTIDTVVRIASIAVIGFTALWMITGIIGWMHRRAYNLTRAESGGGHITPDFLKVDKKKREAAIHRGEVYDKELEKREKAEAEAAAAAAGGSMGRLSGLSRAGATVSAVFTLVAAVVGTVQKVDSLQSGVSDLSSWDKFTHIISQNKVGTFIAVIVIGANILVFIKATKKTTARA